MSVVILNSHMLGIFIHCQLLHVSYEIHWHVHEIHLYWDSLCVWYTGNFDMLDFRGEKWMWHHVIWLEVVKESTEVISCRIWLMVKEHDAWYSMRLWLNCPDIALWHWPFTLVLPGIGVTKTHATIMRTHLPKNRLEKRILYPELTRENILKSRAVLHQYTGNSSIISDT